MKTIIQFTILLLTILFASCESPDYYIKKLELETERDYPAKPKNIRVFSGYIRMKITFDLPADNAINRILLVNLSTNDSTYFEIMPRNIGRQDSLIISNKDEAMYRYHIATVNKRNISSIVQEINTFVYGDHYKSSLLNQSLIASKYDIATKSLELKFDSYVNSILVKSILKYTNTENKLITLEQKTPLVNVVLNNYKKDTDIQLSQGFLYNEASIDTVFTTPSIIKLP